MQKKKNSVRSKT